MSPQSSESPLIALRQLLELRLRDLATKVKADVVTCLLYDRETDEFCFPVQHGMRLPEYFLDPQMLPGADQKAGWIVKERSPLAPIDLAPQMAISSAFARREGIQSALGVALVASDQSVGILFVSFRSPHSLAPQDERNITDAARLAATAIYERDPFPQLRAERSREPQANYDRILAATARLMTQECHHPIAIWLGNGAEYRVRAVSALRATYLREAWAKVGDGSLISRVIGSGQREPGRVLAESPKWHHVLLGDFSEGWETVDAFPINLHGKCTGVIEVFGLMGTMIDTKSNRMLNRFADMVAEVADARIASVRRSERTVAIAQHISRAGDLSLALNYLVEGAAELTHAQSVVFARTWSLPTGVSVAAVSSGTPPGMHTAIPVTQAFIDDISLRPEPVFVRDTEAPDSPITPEYVRQGAQSLVAVPVRCSDRLIGLLFVNGGRKDQFGESDGSILQNLAAQVSTAALGASWLLDPSAEIRQVTERFFTLGDVLDKALEEIVATFQFDFASMQRIHPRRRTIETMRNSVHQIGQPGHPLDVAPSVRDIQADIALGDPIRIEIIGGFDARFDPYTYKRWKHQDLVRVWAPMLIIIGPDGKAEPDGVQRLRWREASRVENGKDWRIVFQVDESTPLPDGYLLQIVGTVDAGWNVSSYGEPAGTHAARRFDSCSAKGFADLIGRWTFNARLHLLPSALETIADGAMRLVGADSASVHFGYDPRRGCYAYEVCAGPGSTADLQENKPDHHGLGASARADGTPKFAPRLTGRLGIQFCEEYPKLAQRRIKSLGAFPVAVDDLDGVLYLYFTKERFLTEDEVAWVKSFCWLGAQAIRHLTQLARLRDYANRLRSLHELARTLVSEPENPDLLTEVAAFARDILGADVVVMYESLPSGERLPNAGICVGRLVGGVGAPVLGGANSAPMQVIRGGRDIFAADAGTEASLGGGDPMRFIAREQIKSVAALPLRDGEDFLGVLFVNFRAPRVFTEQSKDVVRILGASVALAIKAAGTYRRFDRSRQRWQAEMGALLSVDNDIVESLPHAEPDVSKVLDIILRKACDLTGATAGYVMGYDPGLPGRLYWRAGFGDAAMQFGLVHDLDYGLVGLAAKERMPFLIRDVMHDAIACSHYQEVIPHTRSELAVPLAAKEELIGVINLEHPEVGHFSEADLWIVQALAAQAVISVHAVDLYHRMDKRVRPLRSLTKIVSRFQAAGENRDVLIRLMLTGVTAKEGLGFTRAMVLLVDSGEQVLKGAVAIGPASQEEATRTWVEMQGEEERLKEQPDRHFEELLESAAGFAVEVRGAPEKDSTLAQAVRSIVVSMAEASALTQRFDGGAGITVVPAGQPDCWRVRLAEALGSNPPEVHWDFAAMPLHDSRGSLGVLVVDNRYRYPSVAIGAEARAGLEVYGHVLAAGLRAAETLQEERRAEDLEQEGRIRELFRSRLREVDAQILAKIDAENRRLKRALSGLGRGRVSAPGGPERICVSIGSLLQQARKELDDLRADG